MLHSTTGGASRILGRNESEGLEAIELFANNMGEEIVLHDHDAEDSKADKYSKLNRIHPNQSVQDLGESWLHHTFRNLEASLSNEEGTAVDEEKLSQFFNVYDKDSSGSLSYEELKAMLHLESEGEFTDDEFRELLERWDEEHTNSLDLAQFKRFIVSFRGMQLKKSSHRIRRFSEERLKENSNKHMCHLLFKGSNGRRVELCHIVHPCIMHAYIHTRAHTQPQPPQPS